MTHAQIASRRNRSAYPRSPARPVRPGEAAFGGILAAIALVLVLV
ncbi:MULTISPECIES: hypothetical protein [Nitratireductor]|nr:MULTISPECIES: hypothetical protein [Nitratireductor]